MAISRTARHVALVRALETTESARAPLFQDRFAACLLPGSLRLVVQLARAQWLREWLFRYVDARAPGVRSWVIARTCFIDDCVREALAAGVKQYVLLGAGYDCRAHRIEALKTADVFEVDRRETQIDKRRRLTRAGVPKPERLRYVTADFRTQDLAPQLQAAGFDPLAPCLLLCEGVFSYLDQVAVENVLQFAGGTAEHSRFVFTYSPRSVIADNSAGSATDKVFSEVRRLGEPWTFGIEPNELPAFVARFHLTLERNVRHDACRRMYLSSAMADSPGLEFSHLAVARVELPMEQARVAVPS
jgi:methyltransferase (TIGR00027 family)